MNARSSSGQILVLVLLVVLVAPKAELEKPADNEF